MNRGAIAALFCLVALTATQASALTVSVLTQNTADLAAAPGPTSNPSPNFSAVEFSLQTLSMSGITRSPFENTNQTAGLGYGLTFSNIGVGSDEDTSWTGSAGFNFGQSDRLSILWGSPDTYNLITFYTGLNGTGVASNVITGAALSLLGVGHDQVTIGSIGFFMSAILRASNNAFE